MKKFVLIGASGYIAPRHIKAIKNTNNSLIASVDIGQNFSSVVELFPNAVNFSSFDLFEDYVSERKDEIDYVIVCSPNYLHYQHCNWALSLGIDVICEKPLTLDYFELDKLQKCERLYNSRLWSILQLRLHQSILELKNKFSVYEIDNEILVDLAYVTPRDEKYLESWKGDEAKSGGILVNIGLHFFDMLIHIFGETKSIEVHHKEPLVLSGIILFKSVKVRWFLSVVDKHSPKYDSGDENLTYRSIRFNGQEVDFSKGFEDLHTKSYENILNEKGYGIDQNRPVMKLLEEILAANVIEPTKDFHPFMESVDHER